VEYRSPLVFRPLDPLFSVLRPLSSVHRMNAPAVVEVNAVTHRGHVRPGNEDTITVAGWVSDVVMDAPRRSRHDLNAPLLLAVADGMGGHAGGEIASRYSIKRLAQLSGGAQELVDCLAAINSELYAAMAASPSVLGMGTTVAGLVLSPGGTVWFNVGDSRVYALRKGRPVQLSIDDVPPGPRTGIITQTLGGAPFAGPIAPHLGQAPLSIPSRWLLCSDGLSDMLSDAEIEEIVGQADEHDDEAALRALFAGAMAAGGADNISIILVSVTAAATAPNVAA
jgi:PPM family protein phosphatase